MDSSVLWHMFSIRFIFYYCLLVQSNKLWFIQTGFIAIASSSHKKLHFKTIFLQENQLVTKAGEIMDINSLQRFLLVNAFPPFLSLRANQEFSETHYMKRILFYVRISNFLQFHCKFNTCATSNYYDEFHLQWRSSNEY